MKSAGLPVQSMGIHQSMHASMQHSSPHAPAPPPGDDELTAVCMQAYQLLLLALAVTTFTNLAGYIYVLGQQHQDAAMAALVGPSLLLTSQAFAQLLLLSKVLKMERLYTPPAVAADHA